MHMVHGAALTVIHKNPPRHYLGHVVEGKASVVLVPGILGTWSFMKKLGDAISLLGHPVYIVPSLGYNVHSIPSSAEKLRAVIEKIEGGNIVLVAHSKGGLIGKYFLAHYNQDGRVAGLVAIATPFSGSSMAKLVPLGPFSELDTGSSVIADLRKHTEVNIKIVSISPEYDNHVWAEEGSRLLGAENIEVKVHGHHKVVFDTKVQGIVLNSIEKITAKSR